MGRLKGIAVMWRCYERMATRKRKPAIRARRGRVDGGRKARYGAVLLGLYGRQYRVDDSGAVGRTVKKHVASVAVKLVNKHAQVFQKLPLDGPYPTRDLPSDSFQRGYMT